MGPETYIRETLSVGDAPITIYRHESLTSEQVLDRLIAHYAEDTFATTEEACRRCAAGTRGIRSSPGEERKWIDWLA